MVAPLLIAGGAGILSGLGLGAFFGAQADDFFEGRNGGLGIVNLVILAGAGFAGYLAWRHFKKR